MRALPACGIAFAALLSVPALSTMPTWLGFWTSATMYIALSQSWNLLGGYAGQRSFGQALFFGVGAYSMGLLQRAGLSPWEAAVAAVAISGLVAGAVGALSFRSGLRGSYFALVTLAFAEIARIVANSVAFTGGAAGLSLPLAPSWSNLQFSDPGHEYYMGLGIAVSCTALVAGISRSRFGMALVAVRENEEAALALGIDAFRCKVAAMAVSGAMAGAAGMFYMQRFLYLDPSIAFGPGMSVEALLAPIVGGAGTILGPVVGTIVLRLVSEGLTILSSGAPGLNLAGYGAVLIAIVCLAPDGVAGLLRASAGRGRKSAPAKALDHAA